uniref:SJCHGC02996 protein n=1 Tax=Schistosoma japonicum TaxID=6182 RepID=Q5DGF7_SCHJA|nr:SJCHGC02996 protein [Schistosoma japonicum]
MNIHSGIKESIEFYLYDLIRSRSYNKPCSHDLTASYSLLQLILKIQCYLFLYVCSILLICNSALVSHIKEVVNNRNTIMMLICHHTHPERLTYSYDGQGDKREHDVVICDI